MHCRRSTAKTIPDSKVHGANMGPIWGRQDPGGPHVGPMNFVREVLHLPGIYQHLPEILLIIQASYQFISYIELYCISCLCTK